MNRAYEKGLSFGLTSAVITTMGLMLGLDSSTGSRLAVIAGVVSLAFADGFSDALAIHALVEAEGLKSRSIWQSSIATFMAKFFFPLLFLVPLFFFPLTQAIYVSVGLGLILITGLSCRIAHIRKETCRKTITEHLSLAIVVLIITHFVGKAIATYFGV